MRRFKVKEADVGLRADVFISAQYPQFSRSALGSLFDDGLVQLKEQPVKPSYKVRLADSFTVDDRPITRVPDEVDFPVIYEDENVIVIDKPSGVLTHSKGTLNTESTIASFIKAKLTGYWPNTNRDGIVHRLDRGTSGVMIAAKTPEALKLLQKQFSTRKTKKRYSAVVEGLPEPAEAMIDAPIARNQSRPQTFVASSAGRPAQTKYRVAKNFSKGDHRYSLVELEPATGRTHQIRVHLAYIGHPVVGDMVYGQAGEDMMLHADSLELTLPGGERKTFKSAEPPRFKQFMKDTKDV